MNLQPEQEQLLADLVEAARQVPRHEQSWFLNRTDHEEILSGPGGPRRVLGDDLFVLEDEGALKVTSRYTYGFGFVISPDGYSHYAEVKETGTEPLERTEREMRGFLGGREFREAYPVAYARWSDAEELLWAADSDREFTTIGHKVREALQEFATELVARYEPETVETDPARVNRRLGAVIAMFLPVLGEARADLLKALGNYSEAVVGVVQRQEHGGQKKGQALTWQDARRVVFQAACVMHEFAATLEDAPSMGSALRKALEEMNYDGVLGLSEDQSEIFVAREETHVPEVARDELERIANRFGAALVYYTRKPGADADQ